MFSHIVLGTDDIPAAKKFYDAIMTLLGHPETRMNPDGTRFATMSEGGLLIITKPIDGNPASFGNGYTIGLAAKEEALVDKAYQTAIEMGGTALDEPKRMTTPFGFDIRAAYFRDLSGNKLCVAYRYP